MIPRKSCASSSPTDAPWEGRVFALGPATRAWVRWNIDASRQQIEHMPGADYLRAAHHEKWLFGLTENAVWHGLITRAELDTGQADPRRTNPVRTPVR
jgi:hypothetical protein